MILNKIKPAIYSTTIFFLSFSLVFAETERGKIGNPIKADNLQEFFLSIVSVCIMIGTIVAGLAIIYGGLMYVTAQGDEEKISKAQKTLTWAIVGTAILLGSRVILQAIIGTINALE